MENNIHAEDCSLKEILNNINTGLYDINNYDKIRITSKNKPDFVILVVEADASENMIKFFENHQQKDKILFERTFNDFIVVSLNSDGKIINSSIISLFELIISSEIVNVDENEKWSLDELFNCIELDYVEDVNKIKLDMTDLKIMG